MGFGMWIFYAELNSSVHFFSQGLTLASRSCEIRLLAWPWRRGMTWRTNARQNSPGAGMSDTDSFIDEVTEEVRRDRMYLLLRRWGWVGVVAVILIVGGAAFNEVRLSLIHI